MKNIRKELPSSSSEEKVIEMIKNHSWNIPPDEVIRFQEKYETVYGNGTNNSLDIIYSNIK